MKIVSLKQETQLYASLFIACQARSSNLDEFFQHENHNYQPALSENGKLRKTSKSDFLACLEKYGDNSLEFPDVTAKIIDGAALVQGTKPGAVMIFGQYADNVFPKIALKDFERENISRIDIVFGRYIPASLKSETRESRGAGVRVSVKKSTPVWKYWAQFLRTDENKTELFMLLADSLTKQRSDDKLVVATYLDHVKSNQQIPVETLSPCNHEEADTRMFVHLKQISQHGHSKVAIKTVDTDVVVIAVAVFHHLELEVLWIEFGTGKNRRWLTIHNYENELDEDICTSLLFWFCFTGCDTVSSFAGRGKKIACNAWRSFPEITDTFKR